MSHTPDDKSAQEACYMPEDAHDLSASCGHTDLSGQVLEPAPDHGATSNNAFRLSRIPPRRVALCGGGVRGVAHVGVMKAMRDAGFLPHIREVLGISAGSLFALLWVLDYTVEQIETLSLKFDFNLLRNIDVESIFEFPTRYGLDDGTGLERLITSILKQKGLSPDVTFSQMATKFPKRLRCFATELETCRVRQFGTFQSPNVSVKLAIRASMALPIFYTPVQDPETGRLLLDGGLLNNLPLVFMTEAELIDTVCVFFSRWQGDRNIPITSMMEMFNGMYDSATVLKSKPYIDKYRDCIIIVPTSDFGAMNFGESQENRQKLIDLAYEKANAFFFVPRSRIQRRFSVS
jgi:predicted acylesterase/phospholipase RssA